ncbi:hypothetical protein [Urinicoccus massiliensis]|uniref:hypothetical protein n=1 Tax=Urinicoccus massiliensis TaxID=1723382 RepID=UPI001180E32C|nr:hypothetical protein [Urinicoccus massiliensis]
MKKETVGAYINMEVYSRPYRPTHNPENINIGKIFPCPEQKCRGDFISPVLITRTGKHRKQYKYPNNPFPTPPTLKI